MNGTALRSILNGQSLSGFIKLGQAQPPQALEGATITDYVGHTFAGVLGAKIDIAWVPHPEDPKFEVGKCETGLVTLIYAREVANPTVVRQTTMEDAAKTPVKQWRLATEVKCQSVP